MTKIMNLTPSWIDSTVEEYQREQREKDRRPMTEKADPLALSWAAYQVWTKFPQRRFVPLADIEAHDHDREMADATRRYYRDKLTMLALKSNTEPSDFQRELYDICTGGIIRECHRGMIYRLPYFYVEDTRRAELREHTLAQPGVDQSLARFAEKSTRELLPHSRIFQSRRSRETMEYWFHDTTTDEAVCWAVAYDNPLRSLVEHHWKTATRPKIHARWRLGHDLRENFTYWVIVEPELRFG